MSDREMNLLTAADKFVAVHRRWVDSTETLLTDTYEDALLEMVEEFNSGDLPERFRSLSAAVELLADEWSKFEKTVTKRNPQPSNDFWQAVELVVKERQGAVPEQRKPVESVKELNRQKVSPRQIAIIYSEGGVGPFMKDGVPQEYLVMQEIEEPGSVIKSGWVHPAELARLEEAKALEAKRLSRLAAKTAAPPPCQETVEELLRQKVSPNQITKMTGKSLHDVLAEANLLGIKVERQENLTDLQRAHNPLMPGGEDDSDSDMEEDDDLTADKETSTSDSESDGDGSEASLDERIIALAEAGKSSVEISKELTGQGTKVSMQKVAAVVRQHRQAETVQ